MRKTRSIQATAKKYVLIITCLTLCAIHVELASGFLARDVFSLTLRHFITRKGKPKEVLSDKGLNSIGTDRELCEALDKLGQRKIYSDHLKIYGSLILPESP